MYKLIFHLKSYILVNMVLPLREAKSGSSVRAKMENLFLFRPLSSLVILILEIVVFSVF